MKYKILFLFFGFCSIKAMAQNGNSTATPKCIKNMLKQKDSLIAAGVITVKSFSINRNTYFYFENRDTKIVKRPAPPFTMVYLNEGCTVAATLHKDDKGKITVSKGFTASQFPPKANVKTLWTAPVRMD